MISRDENSETMPISKGLWRVLLFFYALIVIFSFALMFFLTNIVIGFLLAALAVLAISLMSLKQGAIYVAGHTIAYSSRPGLFLVFQITYLIIGYIFILFAFDKYNF